MSTCRLGTLPLTPAGKDRESPSRPPALLLLHQLHAPGWEGQAGHDPVQAMGSPTGKQLLEPMGWPPRSSSGTYNWNLKYYEKNISIYNEVQERFIKEIYICSSLGKLSLLPNISSSFHSAWITCNYLLNQLFCSLNLGTWLGKGTSTLQFRSQIRWKETTEFQICCMQIYEFPQTREACLKLFG